MVGFGTELHTLRDVDRGDRTGQWQEWMSRLGVPVSIRSLAPAGEQQCSGWLRRQWIDDLALVDCFCPPCVGSRGRDLINAEDERMVVLVLVQEGRELVEQGDGRVELGAGDAIVWDTPNPIRFRVTEPLRKRSVLIPRAALEEYSGHVWPTSGLRVDASAPALRLLASYLSSLADALPGLSPSAMMAARNATLELLVGALRPGTPLDLGSAMPAMRDSMVRWIDQHLQGRDITPAAVAAAHSVSVRTVHRVFGARAETLGEIVRMRRLARARDDLLGSPDPIAVIAHRWGFSDASHLSRTFKEQFGMPPSAYRRGRLIRPVADLQGERDAG